jgi:CheY-like chemotaxis protein
MILMDLHMPVMDGHDATKKLREKGITSPIIALTANSMKNEQNKCIESGMNDFMLKPISLDVVKSILKKFGVI